LRGYIEKLVYLCVLMVIWKHMCIERYELEMDGLGMRIERYEIEMDGLGMRSKWLNVRE
jgi:hypothetical protein